MASLSSTLRFFSPNLPLRFLKPSSTATPSLLSFSSPISFQPMTSSHSHPPPIRAQSLTDVSSSLPQNLQQIVSLFQSVSDPKTKYRQLLHYGSQLPPYPPQFRDDDHRVRGCVSQVWVHAYPDPADPAKVRFDADSDSALTKGLAALLVFGLSGEPPAVITGVSPEFMQLMGLNQSLTPSRNNGFLNMLKLMQAKAAETGGLDMSSYRSEGEVLRPEVDDLDGKNGQSEGKLDIEEEISGADTEEGNAVLSGIDGILTEENEELAEGINGSGGNSSGGNGSTIGGRKDRMRERLEKELKPVELVVEDVSHMHAGHAGIRGNNSGETHFNLRIISEEFVGKSLVKRHRLVYDLLREELETGLHALSIVAKTPSEV